MRGGKRKGAGRKKLSKEKRRGHVVRVTDAELKLLKNARFSGIVASK